MNQYLYSFTVHPPVQAAAGEMSLYPSLKKSIIHMLKSESTLSSEIVKFVKTLAALNNFATRARAHILIYIGYD